MNLTFENGFVIVFFGAVIFLSISTHDFFCSSFNRFGNTDLLESQRSVLNLRKIVNTFADPQDPITACIQQSHAANLNLTF